MTKPTQLPMVYRKRLMRERLGIRKYLRTYQKYAVENPQDKWAVGQVRYGVRRLWEITAILEGTKVS